jgi:hypothetical protein
MKIYCPKCGSLVDTEADPEHIGNEPDFAFCQHPACLWVTNLSYDEYTPAEETAIPRKTMPPLQAHKGLSSSTDVTPYGRHLPGIDFYKENALAFLKEQNFDMARLWFSKWVEYVRQENIKTGGKREKELEEAKRAYSEFVKIDPVYIKLCDIILSVLKENPGILQTELYGLLPQIEKQDIAYVLYFAAEHGKPQRTKKGQTYALTIRDL